jgi:hypothetical protein
LWIGLATEDCDMMTTTHSSCSTDAGFKSRSWNRFLLFYVRFKSNTKLPLPFTILRRLLVSKYERESSYCKAGIWMECFYIRRMILRRVSLFQFFWNVWRKGEAVNICRRIVPFLWFRKQSRMKTAKKNSVAVVRKRSIPTERPPLVGEVSANLFRVEGVAWSVQRIHTAVNLGFLDRSR